VEMLLGLDADPYSYEDIADNLWPFNIRNKGKRMSTFSSPHSVFSCRLGVVLLVDTSPST
jgi:hypothetical protein